MDRETFFRKAFTLLVGKAAAAIEQTPLMKALDYVSEEACSKRRQRPPGAIAEEEFIKRCSGCDRCMIACPIHVVMIEDWEKRYPLLYPDEGPCIHCDGYPCIKSCPTGALLQDASKELRLI